MIRRLFRRSLSTVLIACILMALPTIGETGGASGSPGASAPGPDALIGTRVIQLKMEIAKAEEERARWQELDDKLAKATVALLSIKATAEAITALGFTFVSLVQPQVAPVSSVLAAHQVEALAITLATLMVELEK